MEKIVQQFKNDFLSSEYAQYTVGDVTYISDLRFKMIMMRDKKSTLKRPVIIIDKCSKNNVVYKSIAIAKANLRKYNNKNRSTR